MPHTLLYTVLYTVQVISLATLPMLKKNEILLTIQVTAEMSGWIFQRAKSNRSKCRCCKQSINAGDFRVGCTTKSPYQTTRWYHISCCPNGLYSTPINQVSGIQEMDIDVFRQLLKFKPSRPPVMLITGKLNLAQISSALCSRHSKFRSFLFGLPQKEQFTSNWSWRCFLATMLVCNAREKDMLVVAKDLFAKYNNPSELKALEGDEEDKAELIGFWKKNNLRHASRKLRDILQANAVLLERYGGVVPNERKILESMKGVGRHVASVSLAWIYEEPEFGIDVHVKRILKRLNMFPTHKSEIKIEKEIKSSLNTKQIGHFSRALVDHGQDVCGYTPECHRCFLRYSCPSANKDLSW